MARPPIRSVSVTSDTLEMYHCIFVRANFLCLGVGRPLDEIGHGHQQERGGGGSGHRHKGHKKKHRNRSDGPSEQKRSEESITESGMPRTYKGAALKASHGPNPLTSNVVNMAISGMDPSNLPWYSGICLRWMGSFGFGKATHLKPSSSSALDPVTDPTTAIRYDKMKKDIYIHRSALPISCRGVLRPGEEI